MAEMSSQSPRTPIRRYSTRSATSASRASGETMKITKNTARKSEPASDVPKHRSRRGTSGTFAKKQRELIASVDDHLTTSPSSLRLTSPSVMLLTNRSQQSDIVLLNGTTLGSQTIEIDGETVIPGGFETEPAGDGKPEEPKELNNDDRELMGLTLKSEQPKLNDNEMQTQFHRRICVLFDGDPECEKARTLRALLDTGSLHSLIFERTMNSLHINFPRFEEPLYLYSVEQRKFELIGMREIIFIYRNKGKRHRADVYVLKDPPEDMEPSFDILLGREHIIKANAIKANEEVVGSSYQVSDRPPHHRISSR